MRNTSPRKYRFTVVAASILVVISGCASHNRLPDKAATTDARITATPDAAPQRSITNFTESLQCMDQMLKRYNIANVMVGAQEVADVKSDIAGTKDMLTTALSTMNRTSGAVRVVALASDLADVVSYHNYHKDKKTFSAPDYFIRLSAPQIDKGVEVDQVGGAIRVQNAFGFERSQDRISSVVSLDINAGLVKNLQYLPGVYSSNSIAVVRRGSATDVSGEIRKLGAIFYVSDDNSEGFHHSVRTLIELGAIEVIGKLTRTPYWECLDISPTSPDVQRQVRDWYGALSWEELAVFVQRKLKAKGLYNGIDDGQESPAFSSAVARYKAQQGLIADGELGYTLYYKLLLDPVPIQGGYASAALGRQSEDSEVTAVPVSIDSSKRLTKLNLSLTTDFGEKPVVYKSGEAIHFSARTTVDAHLYCYYQQGDGRIYKIFPNRFTPGSATQGGVTMRFPEDSRYLIQADGSGTTERIMCMASYDNLDAKLPFVLAEKDLQALPVSSLDKIFGYYSSVARTVPLRKSISIEIQ